MVESLAYRVASRHVAEFSEESETLMKQHREAMDCFDCQAFLQLGIDAFEWLCRADETIREAIYSGVSEHSPDADEALKTLFSAWLVPCAYAEKWIEIQLERGYEIGNLERFRQCEEEVKAIVKSFEGDTLTDAMRQLRDEAIAEHRNGETAEFI